MSSTFLRHHGMHIVGQGGKILVFTAPSLAAAVWLHLNVPSVAMLPEWMEMIAPAGYLLLAAGLLLWGTAVVQLLTGFSRGRLVTSGAYRVVRNPIYSSVAFFVLPAVALLTQTWVYIVVSLFLYAGVAVFIGKEEQQLAAAFGKDYEDYKARLHRMIPFKKPANP